MKWIIVAVLSTYLAFAQTKTIPFDDNSETGCPVTLKGDVSFTPTNVVLAVTAHNNSKLGVLATVAQLDVSPIIFYTEWHDHYFKNPIISAPLSDFTIADGTQFPLDTPSAKTLSAKTDHAFGKILWIQFSDGTTWGDAPTGNQVFTERRQMKSFQTSLVTAFETGGNDAFLKVLSAPPNSVSEGLAAKFQAMLQSSNVLTVVTTIKDRLATGNSRQLK
jgi:hypothetical protein